MVSPEMIRRYPFFAGLITDEIRTMAQFGEERQAAEGHLFFRETDMLDRFYLVIEGEVGIVLNMPARGVDHNVAAQLTGAVETEPVIVSTIAPGQIFGWSALFPPYEATAGAKALKPCRVIAFDAPRLLHRFEQDCNFGYRVAQRLAQVIHHRLHDRRIESLSQVMAGHPG